MCPRKVVPRKFARFLCDFFRIRRSPWRRKTSAAVGNSAWKVLCREKRFERRRSEKSNFKKIRVSYSMKNFRRISKNIYHERQFRLRCGLHALNNLFQMEQVFTSSFLDSIVEKYDRSKVDNDFGEKQIGNYDLTVLMEALKSLGFRLQQINYLRDDFRRTRWDSFFGILLNRNRDHWIAIKKINEHFYDLDSTRKEPLKIGSEERLLHYLISLIHVSVDLFIFAVVKLWSNQTVRLVEKIDFRSCRKTEKLLNQFSKHEILARTVLDEICSKKNTCKVRSVFLVWLPPSMIHRRQMSRRIELSSFELRTWF